MERLYCLAKGVDVDDVDELEDAEGLIWFAESEDLDYDRLKLAVKYARLFAHAFDRDRVCDDGRAPSSRLGVDKESVSDLEFSPLIYQGEPLPTSATGAFAPMADGTQVVELQVHEGMCTHVRHCSWLSKVDVRLPVEELAKDIRVDVTYALGVDGKLAVSAEAKSLRDETAEVHREELKTFVRSSAFSAADLAAMSIRMGFRGEEPDEETVPFRDRLPHVVCTAAVVVVGAYVLLHRRRRSGPHLRDMSIRELKALAARLGVDTRGCLEKAEIVARLAARLD